MGAWALAAWALRQPWAPATVGPLPSESAIGQCPLPACQECGGRSSGKWSVCWTRRGRTWFEEQPSSSARDSTHRLRLRPGGLSSVPESGVVPPPRKPAELSPGDTTAFCPLSVQPPALTRVLSSLDPTQRWSLRRPVWALMGAS